MYSDLRDWLNRVEDHGELRRIRGAGWDLEMNGLAEIVSGESPYPQPVILFDGVPGFRSEFRTLFGLLGSSWRLAMTLGLPENDLKLMGLLRNWNEKVGSLKLVPPVKTSSPPVCANVDVGEEIDLQKFPVPRFNELDGGRYLGTCNGVIQRDPDEDWINVGAYRVMLVDRNHVTLHIETGQHGNTIMHRKYFSRGQNMPVAIAIGLDPALWFSAFTKIPWGVSEYDHAGGIKGQPMEVFEGHFTGLPLPATAEIVVEAECMPGNMADEGPFGEWHGYFANLGLSPVPEPVCEVKAVYYRDSPILTCQPRAIPRMDSSAGAVAISNSNAIWSRLNAAGVAGIKGVWCHSQAAGATLFTVISIQPLYQGHSREVGLIASQMTHVGRYTVVVEDDIDPSDFNQVIWAVATRGKPDEAIQILPHCHSNSTDPTISQEEKRKYKMPNKPLSNSRVVIDACRPQEWKSDWYPIVKQSPELRTRLLKVWKDVLSDILRP
jgi:UbiD family decarboxylase